MRVRGKNRSDGSDGSSASVGRECETFMGWSGVAVVVVVMRSKILSKAGEAKATAARS